MDEEDVPWVWEYTHDCKQEMDTRRQAHKPTSTVYHGCGQLGCGWRPRARSTWSLGTAHPSLSAKPEHFQ